MLLAKDISFAYQQKLILDNVSLEIKQGDILSLLGPNGAGKSTLIKILLGLLQPQVGQVLLEDKNLKDYSTKELAKKIAYVPQTSYLPFSYTALEVVIMGRIAYQNIFSHYSALDEEIAYNALALLGVQSLAKIAYNELSGGQKQLILIARALAQDAKILIMDEPVSGLDYGNQIRLLEQIQNLSNKGYTFLQSTHYPDHALLISNKSLLMKDGKVFQKGKTLEVITEKSLRTLYGVDVKIAKFSQNQYICVPTFKGEK